MRAPLILFAVAAFALPAWTEGFHTQVDIPIDEAVKRLNDQEKLITADHEREVKAFVESDEDARRHWKQEKFEERTREFVGNVHEGVIGQLKNSGQKTVSQNEVDHYAQAFRGELGILRDAIRENMAAARAAADKPGFRRRNWSEIVAETASARQALIAPLVVKNDPKASVILTLDRQITTRLTRPDHGGTSGGGGRPSPANDAQNDEAFGDFTGARGRLNDAIKSGAADAKTYAMRAGQELEDGRYAAASQDAREALKLDPSEQEARMALHFAEGRVDGTGGGEAGAAAGGPAGGDSSSPSPAAAALGMSANGAAAASSDQARRAAENALALGDVEGAAARVDRALASDPRNAGLWGARAGIDLRRRDYARADADAEQGLSFSPKNAALLRAKGRAQIRGRKPKDALATANALIELDPKDAEGYALRAHAAGSLGDREAMLADLRRAAELDPRYQADLTRLAQGVQKPEDADVLFLFPGEEPSGAPAPAPTRARRFGVVAGVAALGGLLMALGLLAAVKDKAAAAVSRLTRRGPAVGAMETPAGEGAPALIRGQYEVVREIGVGGMGMVYEGKDLTLGRRVAIKRMRDELRFDAREKARFVAEARTVAALRHPNIVDIYAIAEDGQDVYLIFEYVDGRTVHDVVRSAGRLGALEAAQIARMTAEALEYAHGRGVIHRDMKPSNVMVDADGRVKVMDFGIARVMKDAMTRLSSTTAVTGTPPYMAPEQEEGHVRPESDVYSLAVCAYEMLVGRLPFVGTGGGMFLNKKSMRFDAPSRAGLPPALDAVFARAFQADPEKRYRTPREFASALESALSVRT